MGLAERRAAQNFATEQYPSWQARIEEAAGFEVPVEVNWEELSVPGYADDYGRFFPMVYFEPLVAALKDVTRDEMGKEAAREGLTGIVIRNSGQYYSSSGFTFAGGVLTLDHKPDTNIGDGEERTKGIRQVLENGL